MKNIEAAMEIVTLEESYKNNHNKDTLIKIVKRSTVSCTSEKKFARKVYDLTKEYGETAIYYAEPEFTGKDTYDLVCLPMVKENSIIGLVINECYEIEDLSYTRTIKTIYFPTKIKER